MFGLSTDLIAIKDKLAIVKRFECLRFERFAVPKGQRSKRQHSNFFTVANLPLVINSVDKPNTY